MEAPQIQTLPTTCCIVGGGPAGIMLGFLLAQAGVEVVVLEKHGDFLRDFRGDTIHPSTLQLLHELGLLEEFLKIPHDEMRQIGGEVDGRKVILGDFAHLPTVCKFIAFMPQWDFLNFMAEKAKAYPTFRLLMNTEAVSLVEVGGTVTGIHAQGPEGPLHIQADLTVACDGRRSTLRTQAGLQIRNFHVPIDVLWMRIPKSESVSEKALGYIKDGQFMVLIDRRTYFQCGFLIPKGQFETIKTQGIEYLQGRIAELAPFTAEGVKSLQDWNQISLLTVEIDRLKRWFKPGLLCIGDAAHAMSPAGGVGVNLAVQDAVATANRLVGPLRNRTVTLQDLTAVQNRRLFPTRIIQRFQVFVHRTFINAKIDARGWVPSLIFWMFANIPFLRRIPAYLVGMGPRPEHIGENLRV